MYEEEKRHAMIQYTSIQEAVIGYDQGSKMNSTKFEYAVGSGTQHQAISRHPFGVLLVDI
ncbi:unnamed protein product [Fusarium venenatum]|uniref:Uncharacterized protein n=1 Tax=Fusarium venenatum TaxID=56646 RepID=A0A2L2SWN6_9HYPO|nr:uncharacterized protein FVRRES_05574 [Fusarium venenatum]CEI61138.1 unnamed protein product [Fusarium venenatum]